MYYLPPFVLKKIPELRNKVVAVYCSDLPVKLIDFAKEVSNHKVLKAGGIRIGKSKNVVTDPDYLIKESTYIYVGKNSLYYLWIVDTTQDKPFWMQNKAA